MKTFVVFSAILAVAMAATYHPNPQVSHHGSPAHYDEVHLTKSQEHDNIGVGGYKYFYEQSDGQSKQESAEVFQTRNADNPEALRVTGSFSFVGQDGQTYTVTYVADENGFQPQGAHLPTPPSV